MKLFKYGLHVIPRYFAVFISVLFFPTIAASGEEAADTKAIKDVYAKHAEAFRHKDLPGLISILMPDCTVKDHGIVIGVAQIKKSLGSQIPRMQTIKEYKEEVVSVQVQGKQATASVHITFTGKIKDLAGTVHDVAEAATEKDTLIKTPSGAWKIHYSEVQAFHVVMDGKAIDPYANLTKPVAGNSPPQPKK